MLSCAFRLTKTNYGHKSKFDLLKCDLLSATSWHVSPLLRCYCFFFVGGGGGAYGRFKCISTMSIAERFLQRNKNYSVLFSAFEVRFPNKLPPPIQC